MQDETKDEMDVAVTFERKLPNEVHPGAAEKMERHGVRPVFIHRRMERKARGWRSAGHVPRLLDPQEARETFVDPRGGETICKLVNAEGVVMAQGSAACHPKDNYVKRTGRGIALARALRAL